MYHALAQAGERPTRYVLPPARLRRQLGWLRLRQRPVLSLDDYVAHRRELRLPPARSVVLTFDDGYADNGSVLPLLRANGMKATFFVVTGSVGDANRWDAEGPLAGRPLFSWDDLRALRGPEIAFGAHTRTHPRLAELAVDEAADEIEASRRAIKEQLGTEAVHFAYPFGNSSEALRRIVVEGGFASGLGISPGTNGPAVPLENLRRLEVEGTRSLLRFVVDLWLGRALVEPRDRH